MQRLSSTSAARCRGNATVISVIVLFVIGSMAGLVLSVTQRHSAEVRALADQNRAFFVAQAALNDVMAQLESGSMEAPDEGQELSLGTKKAPETVQGGRYWVDVAGSGSSTYTLTAHARAGMQQKTIEVVVELSESNVFHNAIFAGNDSGDPGYSLRLGGKAEQGDEAYGDIYSGGDVLITGQAEVFGIIHALGSVTGKGTNSAQTGQEMVPPDIPSMNYELTSDIKVADEFSTGGAAYKSDSAGGSAWQLPEDNPAHIFRRNPSDRTSETSGTIKDDYFLEDPYETVRPDDDSDGSDAYGISLSGVSGEPGANSNQKVFFIDGNLWLHNYETLSLQFKHSDPNGIQVTFVVKGNIYFADNLFYTDNAKDGVAFVAMKDSAVDDSGNIYFGDPEFGAIEFMSAFMYAENNFLDEDLSEGRLELFGNMTAGNQVLIKRDHTREGQGGINTYHSKLIVDFDERVKNGSLDMPGLPKAHSNGALSLTVLSWREVEN
jgi:hypothetical protein